MTTTKHFRELGLNGKTLFLKKNAVHVAHRRFSTFDVHLYRCKEFYAEVWMRSVSGHLCWIEVADEKSVADNYLGSLDINEALGI